MILEGKNIGAFEEINIEFSNLTLLAGDNGSGRSTISKILYLLVKGKDNQKQYIQRDLIQQLERFETSLLDDIISELRKENSITIQDYFFGHSLFSVGK